MKNIKMNEHHVDYKNKIIYCGKTFMKNACKYGTDEYNTYTGLVRDLPAFTFQTVSPKKAEAKMSMKGLTREFMELYIINEFGTDSQDYANFQGMKKLCGKTRNSYMAMRNWFTTRYPDWDGQQAHRNEVKRKKYNEKQNQAELKLKSLEQFATDNQQDEEKAEA